MGSNNITLNNNSNLINDGSILGMDGGDLINFNNNSSCTNNGVMMFMDGSDGIEMDNTSTFTNEGTLELEVISDESIEMDGESSFINNGTIMINMMGEGNDGICLDDGDTYFENNGDIEINNSGDASIEVDDGEFINNADGTITIRGCEGEGLYIETGGTITNEGLIDIETDPNDTGEQGIEIDCDAVLNNNGIINLKISNSNIVDGINLDCTNSGSELNNGPCAVINITSSNVINVESGGTMTNEGVLSTVYDQVNTNDGTISNETGAYILAPSGNFMVAPNPVVNNGTIQGLCAPPTPRVVSSCEGGPCTVPIPTMSQWGLLILGLLLTCIGVIMIRSRKLVFTHFK